LAGRRLGTPTNLEQTTVAQALAAYPDLAVAISDRPIERENRWAPLGRVPVIGDAFRRTMSPEDTRLPTMEIGIGVWGADSTAQFYPMRAVSEAGDIVIGTFAGRRIAVYFDPGARAMAVLYTRARSAEWVEGTLRFSTGEVVRNGVLFDAGGRRIPLERPLQQFTRWYGWALTFPKTTVEDGH